MTIEYKITSYDALVDIVDSVYQITEKYHENSDANLRVDYCSLAMFASLCVAMQDKTNEERSIAIKNLLNNLSVMAITVEKKGFSGLVKSID